jgi:hypothetical protein
MTMSLRAPSAVFLLLSGCAPALSTFTPAHVAKSGHVQLELGSDVSYPTGTIEELNDGLDALTDSAQTDAVLTEDEQREILNAATSTVLNPPSLNSHVGAGVGVAKDVEVQGRLFSGGLRVGGRYQFLHQKEQSVDLSAGLGIGRYSFSLGIPELPTLLDIEDYSRWMVDTGVLVGNHGNWYRWWAGPKLLYGSFDAVITLTPPGGDVYAFSMEGRSLYAGGQAGVALGYKWVFFVFELTVMHLSTSARFAAQGTGIEPYEPSIGGTIYYPGVGLMGEF